MGFGLLAANNCVNPQRFGVIPAQAVTKGRVPTNQAKSMSELLTCEAKKNREY